MTVHVNYFNTADTTMTELFLFYQKTSREMDVGCGLKAAVAVTAWLRLLSPTSGARGVTDFSGKFVSLLLPSCISLLRCHRRCNSQRLLTQRGVRVRL